MLQMKKGLSLVLALVLTAAMFAGCAGGQGSASTASGGSQTASGAAPTDTAASGDEDKVLNIYCWNDQFKIRFEKLYASKMPADVTVNWVITPTDNNAYQNKLDQDLPNNLNADTKIDLFLLEADYILKYVNADVAKDVKEIGLTDADLSEMYEYTKEIATDENGKLKAVSWEADPGVFVYRRSIAKDVFGTDDPDTVQAAISDWSKFTQAAGEMKAKGYKMLSGYDDSYRTFANNISSPWVNANDEIVIDPMIDQWVDQTKSFTDNGYNNRTQLWSGEWNADQGPSGNVFGFFYSTWGVAFTLLGNALAVPEAEGGKREVGNGIYGDYAICYGPASYYWGGTWLAAAEGTDNPALVADIMRTMTCDKETMKQLTYEFEDFVNHKTAMQEVSDSGYTSDFLGGQNHIEMFLAVAPKISMKNVSEYDQAMTETYQNSMRDYFEGNITKEQAVDNFYTAVIEKHPNLKRP